MANLRTPLYDWHVAHGAAWSPFGGWDMPVQYTGVIAEHKAVRTAAGLFDISPHGPAVSFGGPDALDLIQHVFTNNAATMKDGQVRYGLVCNEDGGILRRRPRLPLALRLGDGRQRLQPREDRRAGWTQHKGRRDVADPGPDARRRR